MTDTTWHVPHQRQEIDRVVRRGHRYVVVDETDVEDMDLQAGDVVVLWPGAEGEGHGLAAKVEHVLTLLDRKHRDEWHILTIGEPMEARIGGEGDGGE